MSNFIHTYSVIGITVCYVIFAIQLVVAMPKGGWREKGMRAHLALITVFIFCALTGYLSTLLPDNWVTFRNVMHIILLAASLWLVISNQAAAIAKALTK